MIQKFDDFNNGLYESRYAVLENFTGIDTVMNKVISYNKRQLVCEQNSINEDFHYINRSNPDIYFSYEERGAIKELYKEFLPKVAEAMINELYDAECEFDESVLNEIGFSEMINESWLSDKAKKAWDSVASKAKSVASKTKAVVDDTKEYISDTTEKISKAKDDVKKKIIDKYKNLISFIKKLIESGANSVKEFITNIAKMFEKLGGCVKDALKKLGVFEKEEDEDEAEINVDDKLIDGMTESDGEKSFLKHIIAYMSVMMGDNKKKVDKILSEGIENIDLDFDEDNINEGKVMDKIANNKFLQFILCYGKGRKISIWRSILISIAGTLIISFGLPMVLPLLGVSTAAVPAICAAVRFVWSTRSCFKIILNRYVNKKPNEKLFDNKTILLLAIAILPQIPPFKDWIAEFFSKVMHWLGLDKWIENIGDVLGKLIKKIQGQDPSIETTTKVFNHTIQEGQGSTVKYQGSFDKLNQDTADAVKKVDPRSSVMKFFKSFSDSNHHSSPTAIHNHYDEICNKAGGSVAHGYLADTDIKGGNAILTKMFKDYAKEHADKAAHTVFTTVGEQELHDKTNSLLGACHMIYNSDSDIKDWVMNHASEYGLDPKHIDWTEFGKGLAEKTIKTTVTVTKHINWLMDLIDKSFGIVFDPSFLPILDEDYNGKYKMRFASGTRGAAAYVVNSVKLQSEEEIDKEEESPAFSELKKLHKSAWDKYKKNLEDAKKKDEDKENDDTETPEEPKYIVYYINPGEDTGNEDDKPESKDKSDKGDGKYKDEDKKDEKDDKKNDDKPRVGVIIDPISMMVADVCNFGHSAKIRRRDKPYFMKGLFSRLSFEPIEPDDNKTKKFIRESLGTSMRSLILSNITYGNGAGYISCNEDGEDEPTSPFDKSGKEKKNIEFTVCNPNFITNEKFNADTEIVDMGNLTPNEARKALDDRSNKEAYDLLDGKYGSNISMKTTEDGKTVIKARRNNTTIENIKYYEIDESDYKDLEHKINKDVDFGTSTNKKRKTPRGIVKVIVGDQVKYYRRLSKKLIKDNSIKDDQKLTWAYVHIRPLLTDGRSKVVKGEVKVVDKSLPEKLKDDENIKKLLYKDDKINDDVFSILDEFMYRPEKTFSDEDEHELAKKLNKEEEEDSGFMKKLTHMFKKEEKVQDTFKRAIEIIWDYLSENRRTIFKKKDNMKNHGKTNEGCEYPTLFDELIFESYYDDEYNEYDEAQNDLFIITERNRVIPSFNRFVIERY